MEECKIKNLYNLEETMAKELLEKHEYPWEVLPEISDYIIQLGNKLDETKYKKIGEDIWVAKNAKVAPTAYNQEYKLIDLNNYISNNLLKFSNNVYYLDQSTNNINSFLLNIKDFSEGGYAFVFELYDDNIKVGTIEKKFIVKK